MPEAAVAQMLALLRQIERDLAEMREEGQRNRRERAEERERLAKAPAAAKRSRLEIASTAVPPVETQLSRFVDELEWRLPFERKLTERLYELETRLTKLEVRLESRPKPNAN